MKLALLTLLLIAPAAAQRGDTIYHRPFINQTATGTSGQIRNIGQSGHGIFAVWEDSTGSCAPTEAELYIEASHNGLTYVAISPRKIVLTRFGSSIYYGFTSATGAYPFLRLRYPTHPAGCILNAYYNGTITSAAQPQDRMATQAGYRTAIVRTTSTARTPIVANSGGLAQDYRIAVYGLHVHNEAGTANTPKLQFDSSTACSGAPGATVVEIANFQANAMMVWPTNVVPWAIGGVGSSLCVESTAATALYYLVVYRIE